MNYIKHRMAGCATFPKSDGDEHSWCPSVRLAKPGRAYLAVVCPCDCHHKPECSKQERSYQVTVEGDRKNYVLVNSCEGCGQLMTIKSGSR